MKALLGTMGAVAIVCLRCGDRLRAEAWARDCRLRVAYTLCRSCGARRRPYVARRRTST